MPRRELSKPQQIIDWLVEWGAALDEPASMTLIGSAGLLWHAGRLGLDELPANWRDRALSAHYGRLELIVPSVADLLAPKLRRGEPRDRAHAAWAKVQGLI